VPGETLIQLGEERTDYPAEMEGDQPPAPAGAAKAVDMNATPKNDPAAVVEVPVVSMLEVDENTKVDFQPAMKQMMSLFSEVVQPPSTEEMNLIQDVVKAGTEFISTALPKSQGELDTNLLQTEAAVVGDKATTTGDNTMDLIGSFAKLIDYPISSEEKSQLGSLINTFSSLLGSAEPQKAIDQHLGLTSLLDLGNDETL